MRCCAPRVKFTEASKMNRINVPGIKMEIQFIDI